MFWLERDGREKTIDRERERGRKRFFYLLSTPGSLLKCQQQPGLGCLELWTSLQVSNRTCRNPSPWAITLCLPESTPAGSWPRSRIRMPSQGLRCGVSVLSDDLTPVLKTCPCFQDFCHQHTVSRANISPEKSVPRSYSIFGGSRLLSWLEGVSRLYDSPGDTIAAESVIFSPQANNEA